MTVVAAPSRHLASPAEYYEQSLAAFEAAEQGSGGRKVGYRLGSHAVHLRFAGPRLAGLLTRALAHLPPAGDEPPTLTICCWDTASTGHQVPPPPWPADAYGPRGEIFGFNDGRFHTIYQYGINGLAMLDRERRLGLYWVEAADEVPYWERSFPFRILLHWALANEAAQPAHAGAVGRPDGGVLLAGPSGSGKTTTSVACLKSDLLYAGDDYVLAAAEPEPWVWSLYNSAKLLPESIERLPWIVPYLTNPDRLDVEKGLVYVNEMMAEKVVAGFPLRGIIVPRVTGRRDTEVRPIAGGAALAALAPTTLAHLRGYAPAALGKLAALCRRVPCYSLLLGTDIDQIPRRIAEILDQATG